VIVIICFRIALISSGIGRIGLGSGLGLCITLCFGMNILMK